MFCSLIKAKLVMDHDGRAWSRSNPFLAHEDCWNGLILFFLVQGTFFWIHKYTKKVKGWAIQINSKLSFLSLIGSISPRMSDNPHAKSRIFIAAKSRPLHVTQHMQISVWLLPQFWWFLVRMGEVDKFCQYSINYKKTVLRYSIWDIDCYPAYAAS